jgi:enoyl-CoA hydratase
MTFDNLLYDVTAKIATITLNRPDKRNALSPALRDEIVAALKQAERDDDVTVVLIQGAGESFCSGYDMARSLPAKEGEPAEPKRQPAGWNDSAHYTDWTGQFPRSCLRDWLTIWDLLKPVVAKVHGYCLAGGSELMSMCDIVFAADDTVIGYPPTRAQGTPDVPYFPWKMSMAQAKYLQLTGNSVTGVEAMRMGWIAKSFPADELDEAVARELRPMTAIHPAQLAANKGELNQAYEAMGFRSTLQNAWQWHAMSRSYRPGAGEFSRIAADQGLKAAIEWRDGAFRREGFRL